MSRLETEVRPLEVAGVTLELHLRRARVKNVNARLKGRRLEVSAPPGLDEARLEEIVRQLAAKLLRRRRADEVNRERSTVEVAQRVAARFPTPPGVNDVRFVTTQRSRWGSYSRATGSVRLNAALSAMPEWVVEAVVAHELAHALVPDHSAAFWQLLHRVCPATDRARAFLEGVSWLARSWERLPPVERSLLRAPGDEEPTV